MKNNNKYLNSGFGIILLIGIGILLYFLPCPSEAQYTYFKVALAIAIALLSSILVGFINVRHKWEKTAITAGGGFAMFLITLRYTPVVRDTSFKCKTTPTQYTIILRDSLENTIKDLKGNLSIIVGPNIEKPELQSDGSVDVKGITENMDKYKFKIELNIDKWVFLSTHKKILDTFFTNESLVLLLTPDEKYCCITGLIQDAANNQPLSHVHVSIMDLHTDTDSAGKFTVYIPPAQRDQQITVHTQKDSFYDYDNSISVYLKGSLTIYLRKK